MTSTILDIEMANLEHQSTTVEKAYENNPRKKDKKHIPRFHWIYIILVENFSQNGVPIIIFPVVECFIRESFNREFLVVENLEKVAVKGIFGGRDGADPSYPVRHIVDLYEEPGKKKEIV